jgi:hypothetical protein
MFHAASVLYDKKEKDLENGTHSKFRTLKGILEAKSGHLLSD